MTAMPGYPCPVCRRAGGTVTISIEGKLHHLCSADCGRIFMTGKPLDFNEQKAAVEGGNAGGAYLDSIGRTDLATLTADQWAEFCGKIFQGTCAALRRMADDEIPF